jgi:Secretion system C-terminal sorting domain
MKKIYLTAFVLCSALNSFGQNIPVDFEPGGYGASWTWTVFENDDNPPLQIIANPDPTGLNTSPTVAKFTARDLGQPFAGCETQHGADIGTFNITATNKIIRIMVWKTKISNVGIKLVTSSAASLGEILVPNTLVNQWEQLTFDFSAHIGGMTYDQMVIFPDFTNRTADDIIYFDNIWGAAAFLDLEETQNTKLSIYPNPSNGVFQIESNEEISDIEVYSMDGQLVLQANDASIIDLTNFVNGIYIVRARSNGFVYTQRISKN